MSEKLTRANTRVLELLSEGTRCYTSGNSSLISMCSRGLIKKTGKEDGCGRAEWTITPAGRQILSDHRGGRE